jgi:hypothetical protein
MRIAFFALAAVYGGVIAVFANPVWQPYRIDVPSLVALHGLGLAFLLKVSCVVVAERRSHVPRHLQRGHLAVLLF